VPCARVPYLERAGPAPGALRGSLAAEIPWAQAVTLGPLILADGSAPAEQATTVRVGWDTRALYVRFECADRDAWGTLRQRNDPIYMEEAVEVFLAPADAGASVPRRYWELEVSPLGVLFAARVDNPTGGRAGLVADTSWSCPGVEWQAARTAADGPRQDWWAALAIPWRDLDEPPPGGAPAPVAGPAPGAPVAGPRSSPAEAPARTVAPRWRANFYRIERPRDGKPELSCWSPTFTEPPDFHRPDRFGVLELDGWPAAARGS
jgi:Carbohydrate family 9 binding domain-like